MRKDLPKGLPKDLGSETTPRFVYPLRVSGWGPKTIPRLPLPSLVRPALRKYLLACATRAHCGGSGEGGHYTAAPRGGRGETEIQDLGFRFFGFSLLGPGVWGLGNAGAIF